MQVSIGIKRQQRTNRAVVDQGVMGGILTLSVRLSPFDAPFIQ